jgi:hypothetical protein
MAIDTSGIDETKPESGEATTESVRDNMSAIKTAINDASDGLFGIDPITPVTLPPTTTGTGAAYVVDLGITALTTGAVYTVDFHTVFTSNTPTLNINSTGAKTIKCMDGTLVPASGLGIESVQYKAGSFLWVNPKIEYGSNANGDYIKYPGGNMECSHTVSYTDLTTATGALFAIAGNVTWTFPAVFFSTSIRTTGNDNGSSNIWVPITHTSTAAAAFRPHITSSTAGTRAARLTALGRWKA